MKICVVGVGYVGLVTAACLAEAGQTASAALDGKITICRDEYDTLDGADSLVIFTDWQEFRNPSFKIIAKKLKNAVIFDGRNLYEPDIVKKAGIQYYSIGR